MPPSLTDKKNFHSFVLFIRNTIDALLSEKTGARAHTTPEDTAFLQAINGYLEQHHLPSLSCGADGCIPESFPLQLRDFFDRINNEENITNTGEDAKARVDSREECLRWGNLLQATAHYFQTKNLPIISYGQSFPATPTPDDTNQQPRLWKRIVSTDGTSKIEQASTIDFSRKFVVCIGGLSCFHDNPKALNGFAKQAETLLGGAAIHKEGIDIYCLSHPTAHRALCESRTSFYNAAPEHYASESAHMFVKKYMLPVLGLEHNDTHIPLPTLKERLSRFNFFAFSYGTVFVQEITNALASTLEKSGYSTAEIQKAFAEVYALNLGATCRLDTRNPHGNFSSIYVVSSNDIIARSRANIQKLLEGKSPSEPALVRISDNELLVWTNSPKTAAMLERIENPETGTTNTQFTFSHYPTGHFLRIYAERLPTNDPIVAERPLRHAVLGHRPQNILEMLAPAEIVPTHLMHGAAHPMPNAFLLRALNNLVGFGPEPPRPPTI